MSMTQLLSIRRPGAREKVRRRMPRGGAISQDLAILRRVSREARPFRLHILGLFILTALATPLALLSPVPLTIAVDSVIGSHRPPWLLRAVLPGSVAHDKHALLLVTVGLMVAIIAVRMLQEALSEVLRIWTGERLTLRFRARLFDRAQRLSLGYHDTRGTTDTTYRVQYDAQAIQHVVVDALISMLTSALTVVGMVVVTAAIDWQLALIAIGACPALVLVARWYRNRLRTGWHTAKALESRQMSVIDEILSSLVFL